MPEFVYETLIGALTPLPPGGQVESSTTDPIDVSGARSVDLTFGITDNDPSVYWTLYFGPAPNGTWFPTETGTFETNNHVAIAVPVFGPQLLLQVQNLGSQDETVQGSIYFVRDVP